MTHSQKVSIVIALVGLGLIWVGASLSAAIGVMLLFLAFTEYPDKWRHL